MKSLPSERAREVAPSPDGEPASPRENGDRIEPDPERARGQTARSATARERVSGGETVVVPPEVSVGGSTPPAVTILSPGGGVSGEGTSPLGSTRGRRVRPKTAG